MAKLQDVIDFFIEFYNNFDNENDLTNLKLQKLLYFAQGAHLAKTGELLFDEDIQAWRFGPVVPVAYEQYAGYGKKIIRQELKASRESMSNDDLKTIVAICNWGFPYSSKALVDKTHVPNSPWDITFSTNKYSVIPNELIRTFFAQEENEMPRVQEIDFSQLEKVKTSVEGYPILSRDEDPDEWSEYDHEF